jgi:hypothetical protein
MTSKIYFLIAGIFIGLYVLTTLGVIIGLPDSIHQYCTIIFAGATFLGIRQKKKENSNDNSSA